MEMKRLVITLPSIAASHVLNGLAGLHDYRARIFDSEGLEIDNPVTLESFALGVLRDDLLAKAQAFNIADQEKQAKAQIIATAEATAAQLLPLVALSVEDVE